MSDVDNYSINLANCIKKESFFNGMVSTVNMVVFMGVITLIMVLGGIFVIKGYLTIGGLTAIMMYNSMLVDPLVDFVSFYQKVLKILVSVERINYILNEPITKPFEANKSVKSNGIILSNVEFAYDDKEVLKNINLNLQPNLKVAIVGRSGSGKSTLFKVIAGFYKTKKGIIKVGELELNEENMPSIRKELGIVFQEVFLFDDTVRNNNTAMSHGA